MHLDPKRLEMVCYPAPVLREPTRPIERVDQRVHAVVSRMLRLMRDHQGIGLAAPQVGLPWRLFVANPTGEADGDQVFINPRLSQAGDETVTDEEGCLSLPGVRCQVERAAEIGIEATDLSGAPVEGRGSGLEARVWQHETDHLDGVLILDHMGPMDRLSNYRVLKELEERYRTAGT